MNLFPSAPRCSCRTPSVTVTGGSLSGAATAPPPGKVARPATTAAVTAMPVHRRRHAWVRDMGPPSPSRGMSRRTALLPAFELGRVAYCLSRVIAIPRWGTVCTYSLGPWRPGSEDRQVPLELVGGHVRLVRIPLLA